MLGAAQAQGLYSVRSARVVSAAIAVGTRVQAGQILVRLESLELQADLARARGRERLLNWQLEQQPFDPQLREDGSALRERWTEALSSVKGLEEQAEQLTVRAPCDGRAVEVNESLVAGAWIAPKEKLFEIVGPLGAKAEAFVDEAALPRLRAGSHATFVADTAGMSSVDCRVETIDRVNSRRWTPCTWHRPMAARFQFKRTSRARWCRLQGSTACTWKSAPRPLLCGNCAE